MTRMGIELHPWRSCTKPDVMVHAVLQALGRQTHRDPPGLAGQPAYSLLVSLGYQ